MRNIVYEKSQKFSNTIYITSINFQTCLLKKLNLNG